MKKITLSLLALAALLPAARSQLLLSNWHITSDSLAFDISGSVTTAGSPASNRGLLWLAAPGYGLWINDDMNPVAVVTGTIDGYNVQSKTPTVFSFTGNGSTNIGAFLDFGESPFAHSFNFTDGSNNEVNIHVELTSVGKYNPGNIAPADLELYWGGNAYSSDTGSAVTLNLSAVPEPSTYAAIAGGMAGLVAMIVRRRQKRFDGLGGGKRGR